MYNFKDQHIYLVTDDSNFDFETLCEKIESSILGGTSIVQLREKHSSSLAFYNHALKIKEICKKHKVIFIINDRLDIAQAVDADGVHLGQSDLPLIVARKILGQEKIIGISAKTKESAIQAENDGADYIGVGAVFPTNTKKDAQYITKEEFLKIRKIINIPIYSIGGINIDNAKEIIEYRSSGIAISSAILNTKDSKKATSDFKKLFLK
ncbi:thiamine phosphate synthase [Lutibacter sp. B2]|nr:thiamine phosphate synthase [Lutibacter sp. B2]